MRRKLVWKIFNSGTMVDKAIQIQYEGDVYQLEEAYQNKIAKWILYLRTAISIVTIICAITFTQQGLDRKWLVLVFIGVIVLNYVVVDFMVPRDASKIIKKLK